MTNDPKRAYFADWLRILAVFLLIPFHTAIAFVHGPICYVKDAHTSVSMSILSGFIGMWFMPLLFFVAGISAYHALDLRGRERFIRERLQKLMRPLGMGIIFIIPVLSYFRALQQGFKGSFLSFYPRFFSGIYPNGNFEWGHLWFLAYLFVYTLLTLPLFMNWKRKEPKPFNHLTRVSKGWAIYGPGLLFMLIEAVFRINWPGLQTLVNDWANFFSYLFLYIGGFIFAQSETIAKEVGNKYKASLCFAILTTLTIFFLDISKVMFVWSYNWKTIIYLMLHGLNTWLWVLFLVGYGSQRLNFTNRFLRYANDACFPYYILHYLPVTVIGFYITKLPLPIVLKFGITTLTSIAMTLILYEVLFKRINLVRIAFGMKPIRIEQREKNYDA